jgi:hypothetical protein
MKSNMRSVQSITMLVFWLLGMAVSNISTVYAASASGPDSDHDGLTNSQEAACGTNPKVADSNHNGILDSAEDQDHDGLSNKAEFQHGTKCKSSDSDHDGLSDGQEVSHGTNPMKADTDGDGTPDKSDSAPNDPSQHNSGQHDSGLHDTTPDNSGHH